MNQKNRWYQFENCTLACSRIIAFTNLGVCAACLAQRRQYRISLFTFEEYKQSDYGGFQSAILCSECTEKAGILLAFQMQSLLPLLQNENQVEGWPFFDILEVNHRGRSARGHDFY